MNQTATQRFELQAIGTIEKSTGGSILRLLPAYREGLEGVQEFSHVWVLYWFHENDNARGRSFLRVHPRKDPKNPLTGVFGTRSPLRPNLMGLCLCDVEEVREDRGEIVVRFIDAKDGTPLIDVKPYLPYSDCADEVRLPEWARTPPDVAG